MQLKLVFGILLVVLVIKADRNIKQRFSTRHGAATLETVLTKDAKVNSAPDDEDIFKINRRHKLKLVDGDIQRKTEYSSITNETLRWPDYKVPVEYGKLLPLLARAGIDEARLEYEMRTCMRFPDRVDEPNYLHFEPQSGCWSYVGMQGGRQTVSIGSGCEKRATIQHEMMHALGVHHQQSRADRDDYVMIMTENIGDDHIHNFDTYTYDEVDEHRVSYDYNSVMHYSDTSFSTNGEKTIVTFNPEFQDVIGQRRTFSEGDATTINRIYPCGDPIRLSYSCGFEADNACGYVQDTPENPMSHYSTSDVQSTTDKAPVTDNTFGKKGEGRYMLFNSEGTKANDLTVMRSMRLKTKSDVQCLEFSYYMDLDAKSAAKLRVYWAEIDETTGAVINTQLLTEVSGDLGSFWNMERLTFHSEKSVYKLLFEVESGGYSEDVIAIDDIQIQDKACETNYFKVQEFSKLLANTGVGDGVYGPLLYTDEGYAFKLLFYPHGRSETYEGYVSTFFALAKGENDDSLRFPFYDRVIKMSVVDQGPEKLTSMNQFSQYITSDDHGDSWMKPITETNGGIGYSTFMPLSDILNTRNFIKNDAVIFSINVRNMQGQGGLMPTADTYASDTDKGGDHHGQDNHGNNNNNQNNNNNNENGSDEDQHFTVDVNVQPWDNSTDTTENMISTGAAIGLAMTCTLIGMGIMLVAILVMSNTHKKAIRAMAALAQNPSEKQEKSYNNLSYGDMKI